MLLLTKEDINCRPVGSHFEIVTKDGIAINLNEEAMEELRTDLNAFKEMTNINIAPSVSPLSGQ